MYKLLALDLDGTVLTDKHTIHPEVKKALNEIKNRCHIIIVTGRHHIAARTYHEELELDTPIICCNGTYIYDYKSNQVIEHNEIKKEHALEFIKLAKEYQMKLVMYISDAMTYSNKNPIHYMEALEKWANESCHKIKPKIKKIDSFTKEVLNTEHVWKFVVEGQPRSIESLLKESWVAENFNAERSWSNRIDFAAKGNNKGKCLAKYVNDLGYSPHQVIAVGDNHNDISMLNFACLGVAMKNADQTVQSHAQLVCETDNNHDGLARLIRNKI